MEWFLHPLDLQMARALPLFHLLHQMRLPLHCSNNCKHRVLQDGHLLGLDSRLHHRRYRPFSNKHISINTNQHLHKHPHPHPHPHQGLRIRNRMRRTQGVLIADLVGMEGRG